MSHSLEPIARFRPSDPAFCFQHAHLVSLDFIQQFNIAKLVPTGGGTTTFAILAEQCGLPEADVRRLLRHAMTIRVFDEPHENAVVHTRASMLIRDEGIHGWIGSTCQNMWPGATRVSPSFSPTEPVSQHDVISNNHAYRQSNL